MSLEFSPIHTDFTVVSINDDNDKPFPVDNEAKEDDEENAKNSQCYSDGIANDSWNVDKDYDRKTTKGANEHGKKQTNNQNYGSE